jgi:histidine triad (HIT) family protein
MPECIFCQVVSGDIPSIKIYEDDKTLAFLDVSPINYGHTLVISKDHYTNLENIAEEDLCAVMKTVKLVGAALKKGLGISGYNVLENNDPVAGQVIPHVHFHVVPRYHNDGLKLWPQGRYGNGEAEEVADRIKAVI